MFDENTPYDFYRKIKNKIEYVTIYETKKYYIDVIDEIIKLLYMNMNLNTNYIQLFDDLLELCFYYIHKIKPLKKDYIELINLIKKIISIK